MARGEPEPPAPWPRELDTDDTINAWINERSRGRSLADVLADARASYDRLAAVVRALPEDALVDPNRFAWAEGNAIGPAIASGMFFGHLHDEHEPDVRAWLAGAS